MGNIKFEVNLSVDMKLVSEDGKVVLKVGCETFKSGDRLPVNWLIDLALAETDPESDQYIQARRIATEFGCAPEE
jgi:hypothetical protein